MFYAQNHWLILSHGESTEFAVAQVGQTAPAPTAASESHRLWLLPNMPNLAQLMAMSVRASIPKISGFIEAST